jgi:hypothetical protein
MNRARKLLLEPGWKEVSRSMKGCHQIVMWRDPLSELQHQQQTAVGIQNRRSIDGIRDMMEEFGQACSAREAAAILTRIRRRRTILQTKAAKDRNLNRPHTWTTEVDRALERWRKLIPYQDWRAYREQYQRHLPFEGLRFDVWIDHQIQKSRRRDYPETGQTAGAAKRTEAMRGTAPAKRGRQER